ncbi:hypothetical protein Vafri_7714, partial [Volvox africanus]
LLIRRVLKMRKTGAKRVGGSPTTPQLTKKQIAERLQEAREGSNAEASTSTGPAEMAPKDEELTLSGVCLHFNKQIEQLRESIDRIFNEAVKGLRETNKETNKEMALNIQRQIEQLSSHYEQKFSALEQQLEGLRKEHTELSARIQEDNQGVLAKAMHEDRLLAYVPEEHIADIRGIVTEIIRQERPGTDIMFSITPRPQKQGGSETAVSAGTSAPGGQRPARPLRRMVDIRVHPADRRALATLGGILNRKYNITIMDALTRSGRELRQQRMATYIKLRDVEQVNPRWTRGADISIEKNGKRIPYDGPWVPSGGRGSGNGEGTH